MSSTLTNNASSKMPTIAVLEFVCGGGMLAGLPSLGQSGTCSNACDPDAGTSAAPLSDASIANVAIQSLYDEGFAMLSTLMVDLSKLGCTVVTALDSDSRLNWSQFQASVGFGASTDLFRVQSVDDFEHWLDAWLHVARRADRTILIAPETDNLLVEIATRLRGNGIDVWGSDLSFLEMTSKKQLHYRALNDVVQQPPTFLLSEWNPSDRAMISLKSMPFPTDGWVLKRADGAGCMDMIWFPDVERLLSYIAKQKLALEHYIVQPWLRGQHASCVVLVNGEGEIQLVGAMTQRIEIDGDSGIVRYQGGEGPILVESNEVLRSWVDRILAELPGARGWIGVDFMYPERVDRIESPDQLLLIEINPRLTTSYLGYRRLYGATLAAAVLGLPAELNFEDRESGNAIREKIRFGLD